VLAEKCSPDDTIAVFGSSHSAIMIVRDLLQLPVKRVLNFYRHDLIYAEYRPEGIVNDSTGLKEAQPNGPENISNKKIYVPILYNATYLMMK
jgi:hypothetical protein